VGVLAGSFFCASNELPVFTMRRETTRNRTKKDFMLWRMLAGEEKHKREQFFPGCC
jgi:hypothetical protein